MRSPVVGVEEYWSRPSAVDSAETWGEPLPYEIDLLRRGIERAGGASTCSVVASLGVGAGRELTAIRDAVPAATIRAIDISAPMIERCRQTARRLQVDDVQFEVAAIRDAERHPSVDVAVAFGAVLSYPIGDDDRLATLRGIRSLLRPGGAVALVVQQRNGRPDWAAWFAGRGVAHRLGAFRLAPGDRVASDGDASLAFHHYSRRELTGLLARCGFTELWVASLREWARSTGHRIPRQSPNPLLVLATAPQ